MQNSQTPMLLNRSPRQLASTLLILCSVSCGTPAPAPWSIAARPPLAELPDVSVVARPAPRSLIRLAPVEWIGTANSVTPSNQDKQTRAERKAWIQALWTVAWKQSARFDVAASEDADGTALPKGVWRPDRVAASSPAAKGYTITLQIEVASGAWTVALLEPGSATLPVASRTAVPSDDLQAIAQAVDTLTVHCRIALGEDLSTRPAPVPAAQLLSTKPRVAALLARADASRRRGAVQTVLRTLSAARRLDGGSPTVLDQLAAAHAVAGDRDTASAVAREALTLTRRLDETTRHRLARTLVLAQTDPGSAEARGQDQQLLALGHASLRERPADIEGLWSTALAENFLGAFDQSLPRLEALMHRLPHNASVAYHAGWALLAAERAEDALDALQQANRGLPRRATFVPQMVAWFQLGKHERIASTLRQLRGDDDVRAAQASHELMRIQAAHALLRGRRDDAVRWLLEDLEWLRARPAVLAASTVELVEAGETLVRLGQAEAMATRLTALGELSLREPFLLDALAYLEGLIQVTRTSSRARTIEAGLARTGSELWQNQLAAFGAAAEGALADEVDALTAAAKRSDSTLVHAALAQAWERTGNPARSQAMLTDMGQAMAAIDLRRPLLHPLFNPARALAYLAVEAAENAQR